jgi:hypothetical protein
MMATIPLNKRATPISRLFTIVQASIQADDMPKSIAERNAFRVSQLKAEFGSRILSHPDYKFNPRHSNNPEIYIPARQDYLNGVAFLAQVEREKNPAWHRAQAIQTTLSMEH